MSLVSIFQAMDKQRSRDLKTFVEDSQAEERMIPPMEPNDTIRASGIVDFCPREEAICIEKRLTRKKTVEGKLGKIFKFGRIFELYQRDNVLGDLGLVIGKWECNSCGHIPEADLFGPRYQKPKQCQKCGKSIGFTYVEEFAKDNITKIGGKNDCFLYWNNEYYIVDFKTANDINFKKYKKEPNPSHVGQLQMYMKLHGYKKGIIWLYNKNSSEEHLTYIDYDPAYASRLNGKGQELQGYFNQKIMPARMCVDIECSRAKDCAVKELCFTGEFKNR